MTYAERFPWAEVIAPGAEATSGSDRRVPAFDRSEGMGSPYFFNTAVQGRVGSHRG